MGSDSFHPLNRAVEGYFARARKKGVALDHQILEEIKTSEDASPTSLLEITIVVFSRSQKQR